MQKKNLFPRVFCLMVILLGAVIFAAAQHEGHDSGAIGPTTDGPLPRAKGDETTCQRVARLVAELDQEFDDLLGISDPSELQRRLSGHKVRLRELRAATGVCSQQCEKRPKRKGCGPMMRH